MHAFSLRTIPPCSVSLGKLDAYERDATRPKGGRVGPVWCRIADASPSHRHVGDVPVWFDVRVIRGGQIDKSEFAADEKIGPSRPCPRPSARIFRGFEVTFSSWPLLREHREPNRPHGHYLAFDRSRPRLPSRVSRHSAPPPPRLRFRPHVPTGRTHTMLRLNLRVAGTT